MAETINFRVGNAQDQFDVTVKADFVKTVPDYQKLDLFTLAAQHGIWKFLHNPAGPALIHVPTGIEEYWLNGTQLDGEAAEKIKHSAGFHDKFEKSLED